MYLLVHLSVTTFSLSSRQDQASQEQLGGFLYN